MPIRKSWAKRLLFWAGAAFVAMVHNLNIQDSHFMLTKSSRRPILVAVGTPVTAAPSPQRGGTPVLAISNQTFFLAANLFNSEGVLQLSSSSSFATQLLRLVDRLGPTRCFVSIYENGSSDATPRLLGELAQALRARNSSFAIESANTTWRDMCPTVGLGATVCKQVKRPLNRAPQWLRIPLTARLRNRALRPLLRAEEGGDLVGTLFPRWGAATREAGPGSAGGPTNQQHRDVGSASSSSSFSAAAAAEVIVVFLNDVVFDADDVVQLIGTNGGDYDLACGLDFNGPWPTLYDVWVMRALDGQVLWNWWPFFRDWASVWKLLTGAPVRVYSCWNGVVAFPAAAVLRGEGGAGIAFRSWAAEEPVAVLPPATAPTAADGQGRDGCEHTAAAATASFLDRGKHEWRNSVEKWTRFNYPSCTVSECALFCKDLWAVGRGRIFVNPAVRVDYGTRARFWRRVTAPVVNTITWAVWMAFVAQPISPPAGSGGNISVDANGVPDACAVSSYGECAPTIVQCGIGIGDAPSPQEVAAYLSCQRAGGQDLAHTAGLSNCLRDVSWGRRGFSP